ncbi:MAG: hypothetical protein HRT73_08020, partial [Flavobacteriales bacterium]|nr:hypothetical protein [Flavobacteriales bacterium]
DPAVRSGITPQTRTDGTKFIYPNELDDVEDFLAYWKPSWGLSLLKYHPEYCYLDFICGTAEGISNKTDLNDSYAYNQSMFSIQDYATAASQGYLNPLHHTSPPAPTSNYNIDPFRNFLTSNPWDDQNPPTMLEEFEDALEVYYVDGIYSYSIWEIALVMVYCPSATTSTDINTCLASAPAYGADPCNDDLVWRQFRELYLGKKTEYFDLLMTYFAIERGCYNGCIQKDNFDENSFSFRAYSSPNYAGPYNGFNDIPDGTDEDQPCNTQDYLLYKDKVKIVGTTYDDFAPPSFPPSQSTISNAIPIDIADFCGDMCEMYATDWITQLSNCVMTQVTEYLLKIELKELCSLQCDPNTTTLVTLNGNTSLETILEHHLGIGYETATCNSLIIIQPGPTFPVSEEPTNILDNCGCDKVLQNEWNFTNNILPVGVLTSEDLFFDTYGYNLVDYSAIACECNSAFELDNQNPLQWEPGAVFGTLANAELLSIAKPLPEELLCEQCLDCIQVSSDKALFDAKYSFYSSSPSYYGYLANYLNTKHELNFAPAQIEQFIQDCATLNGGGSPTLWEQTKEGEELEKLLDRLVKGGDLFYDQATPLNLVTYIGNSSLEQYSTGYNYWSNILPTDVNKCNNSTITLNVGNVGGGNNCTINLDLSPAITAGFNFDFCDIIELSNLRSRSTTCSNVLDFSIDAKFFQGTAIYTTTIYGTSSCYPIATCYNNSTQIAMCNLIWELEDEEDCEKLLIEAAQNNAEQAYIAYYNSEYQKILAELKSKCISAEPSETFDMTYWNQEHHFTLYYYDQSSNLFQTVPPEGVKPFTNPADILQADNYRINNTGVLTPPHELTTKYRYNSYNQLTEQKTPDAGVGNFWYDIAGRLVVSQNAQQIINDGYSYTIYDSYGRIIEVGKNTTIAVISKTIAEDLAQLTTWYNSGVKTEITKTFYDKTLDASIDAYFSNTQENLRLRVATVAYYETDGTSLTYDNAIHYSYDIAGNVKHAVMENKELEFLFGSNSIKHLSYNYDLVSGNVNQVIFQEGEPDQYYHKYNYDEDNRIHEVLTSKNGLIWDKDAKYFYYPHGPLARIELGDEKVQGIDLAYTIQGWLKGVNSNTLDKTRDQGKDAIAGYLANAPSVHKSVAKDAFGYSLSYFNNDYTAISQPTVANHFEASITGSTYDVANSDLFNGNIKSMVTAIEGMDIYGNAYQYDQLNRLRTSTVHNGVNTTTNTWVGSAQLNDYHTDITYDGNGNIQTLLRNGSTAPQLAMDNMSYSYYPNTNQLADVSDLAADNAAYSDIKSGMASNNYVYDNIGNLITDLSEEIDNIEWTVYGKVKKITRTSTSSKPDLEFKYDAMGNRLLKLVKPRGGAGVLDPTTWTHNYYQYDAGGNMLGIYE